GGRGSGHGRRGRPAARGGKRIRRCLAGRLVRLPRLLADLLAGPAFLARRAQLLARLELGVDLVLAVLAALGRRQRRPAAGEHHQQRHRERPLHRDLLHGYRVSSTAACSTCEPTRTDATSVIVDTRRTFFRPAAFSRTRTAVVCPGWIEKRALP